MATLAWRLQCRSCGHRWYRRSAQPRDCPRCKRRFNRGTGPTQSAEELLRRAVVKDGHVRILIQFAVRNPDRGDDRKAPGYRGLRGTSLVVALRSPGLVFAFRSKIADLARWLEEHGQFPGFA